MKSLSLTLLTLLVATVSNAQMVLGGDVTHNLSCSTPVSKIDGSMALGAGYSMRCVTAPVSPIYSLRDCELFSHAVVPNAPDVKIEIKMKVQTISAASFASDDHRINILVDKLHLSAVVNFGNNTEMTCAPQP